MLILAAILGILIYGIVAATWGTFNPTLGFTNAQIGTIATAQAIGLVVASISVGPLIDLKGKKIALVGGLALISISFWLLPFAGGDFTLVLLALALLGLGGGIVVTGANALVSDVSESRRGSMLNILNLFFGLGGLITPFVTANILGGSAVRMCYVAAVLATIALIVNIVTPMPKPTGERGFKASEIGSVVGRPALYMLALFLFLYIACEVGVWNWLALYLIRERGLDRSTAFNILALGFALGLLVGRLAISRILINVSALSVTLGASVAMAITTFAMLQVASPSAAWVVVFCAGMAMAPIFPTTLALVGDAFPRMTATAMGIVITCGWLGLAVSSPIIGSVSKNLGTALLLIPGFSVIMILVNLALRPLLRGLPTNAAIPVRIDDTKWLYPLVGGVAGAVVGYLTRPSGMLGGQLPFGAVITRGGSLQGLDEVLVPLARQSFNQMAAGTIAGAMLGGVAGAILRRMNPAKPRPQ